MPPEDATSWTILRDAASGDHEARAAFVRRYMPAVRAYLNSRWGGTVLFGYVDDTAQEVFVQFLRPGNLLDDGLKRLDSFVSFRAYLRGLVRNVARMTERREYRRLEVQSPSSPFDPDALEAGETRCSVAFDRAWAKGVIAETIVVVSGREPGADPDVQRRYELVRLRFRDGLSVQEIADREGTSRFVIYRELEKAGQEFRDAMTEVLRKQAAGSDADIESQRRRILEMLE